MTKVHLAPLWVASAGLAGLAVVPLAVPLSPAGWVVGALVPLVSTWFVELGLLRRAAIRFGPANTITGIRAALVGVAAALAATSLTRPVAPAMVLTIVVPALVLDAFDGWVARRTDSVSELGARYDMVVDAFLLLVLGVLAAPLLGWWVLAIGLMRYAFVVAGWVLPWLQARLPSRYWRKVVTAANGIALTAAASGALPRPVAFAVVAAALGLLTESFGRDVVWLVRARVPGEQGRPRRPRRRPGAGTRLDPVGLVAAQPATEQEVP